MQNFSLSRKFTFDGSSSTPSSSHCVNVGVVAMYKRKCLPILSKTPHLHNNSVFCLSLTHTSKYTAAGTIVNTHSIFFILYIMLLFITAVKEILIIISVFLVLSFQDSVSLQDADYFLLLQLFFVSEHASQFSEAKSNMNKGNSKPKGTGCCCSSSSSYD
jgi:hypothetical protein